ncbi:hypothetical protein QFC22_004843 [Naganishia vaughanmartiniae]|uniref:Uncharacterized protein n=1 Tax=Naganishia vaughanmartiniae TaxID=1424756 RepID=A0ACC2WZ29_9TREE|nr:hypothetical protein QFC22_004843 [Naganishia vaughanmartiniae]
MRSWTPSVPRLARLRARVTERTYSCSSSSSSQNANTGSKVNQTSNNAATSSATTSKLRLAMNARKLLGAGGSDGSGRLAMRRESILASHVGKKSVSSISTKQNRHADTTDGLSSSAAAFIANPHAFRPVHLYQPQYALHASFTPAHMPLPVHLGIQTYYKPDSRMKDAAMFTANEEKTRVTAINNIVKVAQHDKTSRAHRKRMTNLREHLATVANLSTNPELAASLSATHPSQTKPAETFDQEEQSTLFDGFYSNAFGPSSEFSRSTTFDEMVSARLGHNGHAKAKELTPLQQADRAWDKVLAQMDSAVAAGSPEVPAPRRTTSDLSISEAVSEVESLLGQLGLGNVTIDSTTPASSFLRRPSMRRVGRIEQMAFRPSRVSMIGADVQIDQVAWMDSVKRKRKKKISKHKYKKRRKATRAERKKLGK